MSPDDIEFGLNSFGEVATENGRELTEAETVRLVIEEAELAESVGVDSFSVGEHYRPGFVDSAGLVLLAAIAGRTSRIRLGTSVTVLSTQDPVRLYNQAATLDAASRGRAQLIVGRASSVESFPLFGYDLAEYETLFEEKLDLFVRLLRDQPVTWSGTVRSSLTEQIVTPAIEPGAIPTWVGVGGSPQSVLRAANYGLPLMLAIIGGQPGRFAPYTDLYRRALTELGLPELPIGEHSLGLLAPTDEEAREVHWPLWRQVMETIGAERGFLPPTPERYRADTTAGALFVGAPETVARRIADAIQVLGLSRFDLKYDLMRQPREIRARTIELYGTRVIPRVRELLSENLASAVSGD
ncbi:MAG: LLM class flavin-dependent oxidoreductase [Microbacteriaceae bacterium]